VAHLIEVAFKGNRREFFLWEGEAPPAPRTAVIVDADRGEDLGHVHAVGDLAALRAKGCTHGLGGAEATQRARRLARREDLTRHEELRAADTEARREALALIRQHQLEMKLSDAEWRWDRRKLTFYFTAEKRVDFRALVRDLAARFKARIELKQIGVRDEAKRLDGVGRCGRQYCSAAFLTELRPISLGLAKDQKLSLNPTQISGACGRLMCCLRFEHDWYVETRRRFPKEGRTVTTAQGEEKVLANDLFRERVTLRRLSDGEQRSIPLSQLDKELRGEPIEPDTAPEPLEPEAWSDELLSMTDTVERPIPRDLLPSRPEPTQRAARRARPERTERPVRLERAPRPAPPTPPPPPPPAATPEDSDRPRRRRGRRGGRRGKGGNGPTSPSSGDAS
jgi:cell fate regulator YaaT (PSP1 superfamily)